MSKEYIYTRGCVQTHTLICIQTVESVLLLNKEGMDEVSHTQTRVPAGHCEAAIILSLIRW